MPRVIDEYPRESKDLVPFTELLNRAADPPEPITEYKYAVTMPDHGQRPPVAGAPTGWSDPTDVDGTLGHLLDGTQLPGLHRVFAWVDGATEGPVIELGDFRVT